MSTFTLLSRTGPPVSRRGHNAWNGQSSSARTAATTQPCAHEPSPCRVCTPLAPLPKGAMPRPPPCSRACSHCSTAREEVASSWMSSKASSARPCVGNAPGSTPNSITLSKGASHATHQCETHRRCFFRTTEKADRKIPDRSSDTDRRRSPALRHLVHCRGSEEWRLGHRRSAPDGRRAFDGLQKSFDGFGVG